MKKQVNIIALIVSVALAILFTFGTTFVIMANVDKARRAELAKEYEEQLKELEETIEGLGEEGLGVFSSIAQLYNAIPKEDQSPELYYKLAMIDYYYRKLYANEIDEDKLIYSVLNGYIQGAEDKYGEYYTADDYKTLVGENQGNSVGIGVYVNYSIEYDAIKILSVMENSPAYKAGIKSGDIVTHIDGESVSELGYYIALDKVKGDEGTQVELTILRNSEKITVKATRAKFETKTIYYHQYEFDKTIGVVRIVDFNNAMPQQFKNAIEDLTGKGVKSLVFDLRNNPGGTLDSVIEILDYLLPEGVLAHVTDADGKVLEVHKSDADYLKGIDSMAVLINENTASAAELFSCALKDYEVATLVGVKTYGKGSMQTVFMLPDGTGLRITTNKYNPPKTENYDGVGIKPDIEVELSDALNNKSQFEYTDAEDNQLKEACDAIKNNKQN